MLKANIEKAINEQINAELYSAYLYFSMSAFFAEQNLKGFAVWMRIQAQEEMVHATKFYDYIIDRGGTVKLTGIDDPPVKWKSSQAVFEETYKHETIVTARINNIADMAMKEKDHATLSMLNWFVDEQVEEEAAAQEILQQLKLIKNDAQALLMLDRELGARTFAMPAGANVNNFFGAAAPAAGA